MIKPTKYKSITTADLKGKTVFPLAEPQKIQANTYNTDKYMHLTYINFTKIHTKIHTK